MILARVKHKPLRNLQIRLTLDVQVIIFSPSVHTQLFQAFNNSGKAIRFLLSKLTNPAENCNSSSMSRNQSQNGNLIDL